MISSLELARLCGVSQGTVDRALHDRPGVAAATRARILRIAAKHGYRPNPAARELMGLAASTLVAAIVPESGLQAGFFTALLSAIATRLRRDGLRLVVTFADTADDQAAALADLAARRLRAAVLIHPDAGFVPPIGLDVPVAALVLPLGRTDVVDLIPDETQCGVLAARHLLDLGHRRLGFVGNPPPRHVVGAARWQGFSTTARAAGATVTDLSGAGGDDVVTALRRADCTAVFCHHDPLAVGLIARLAAAGLRVPDDCSVIGVDGADGLPGPRLTTIAYPFAAMAEQVASLVLTGVVTGPALLPTLRRGETTASCRA